MGSRVRAVAIGGIVLAEPVRLELVAGFALVLVSLVLVLGLPVPRPVARITGFASRVRAVAAPS